MNGAQRFAIAGTGGRAPAAIIIGPSPPPYHGCTVATGYVLDSGLAGHYRLIHLDTADRRGLDNMGRLDPMNVVLALRHFVRFVSLLVRHRPAVVYVPIAQNTLGVLRDMLFMVPALLARRDLVVHIHGGGFGVFYDSAAAPLRAAVRAVVGRARTVIILGAGLKPTLRGIVPDHRVRVIPNGIPDLFPEGRVHAAGGPLRVLYLGNLIRSKGFVEVLGAVVRLVAAGVDVRLDLAGGWAGTDERSAAAPLLDSLGTAVRLHGEVGPGRKRELLAAADVLALPTYYEYEGHPYVILEAMSAGLPVVTTAHAAIPETVLHERTGLIVPPRDVASLADALQRLATDAALRQRLGESGRTRFLQQYTLQRWSQQLVTAVLDVPPAVAQPVGGAA
jgi:glycosyltransferase involved in cell wall biosynthesis